MKITDTMKKTWSHLIGSGATKEGAAGLMGNLYAESLCNPVCLETLCIQRYKERLGITYTSESYMEAVDRGTVGRNDFIRPMGYQYGWGLCQWTSPGRKGKLYDHCKARKVSIGDLQAQLEFLITELQQSYPSVWQVLTTTDSIKEASDIVLTKFEMPADCGGRVKTTRQQYATEFFYHFAEEADTVAKATAQDVINVIRGWIGYSEANGKHKRIVDIYNNYGAKHGYPRGYKVPYSVAWCDVTVSAAFIQAGAVDLIGGIECGVEEHIQIFKKKGIWIEDGTITPKPGYIICYNWDQYGQPNEGYADHIGIVESVKDGMITIIEGNYNDAVQRRQIKVGWGYIRGYAAPKYADNSINNSTNSIKNSTNSIKNSTTQVTTSTYTFTPQTVSNGSAGKSVLLLQTLLRGLGYLGNDSRQLDLDGQAGANTIGALRRYQADHALTADGVAGVQTWSKIIGI